MSYITESCQLEMSLCGWHQEPNDDDFDWIRGPASDVRSDMVDHSMGVSSGNKNMDVIDLYASFLHK